MRRFLWLLALLAAGPASAKARVAVLPVLAYGLPSDRVEALEVTLAPAVAAAAGEVLDKDRTRALLSAAEASLECSRTEVPCLVDVGALLAVSTLVVAKAESTPEGTLLTLRVIDVVEEHEERRLSGVVAHGDPAPDATVRNLVFRLFHDSASLLGGLQIDVVEDGAEVVIDGEARGRSPLAGPVLGLPIGPHRVLVRLDGHPPIEREVEVTGGAVRQITVRVIPEAKEVITVEEGVAYDSVRAYGFYTMGGGGALAVLGAIPLAAGAFWAGRVIVLNAQTLVDMMTITLDCLDERCDTMHLKDTTTAYGGVAVQTWIGSGIGIFGTIVTAIGIGAVVSGLGMVIFGHLQEVEQTAKAGAAPEEPQAAPGAPGPEASAPSPAPRSSDGRGLAAAVVADVQSRAPLFSGR